MHARPRIQTCRATFRCYCKVSLLWGKAVARRSHRILTLNSGSSSLRFALYQVGPSERLEARGYLDRIGVGDGRFRLWDADGNTLFDRQVPLPNHEAALATLLEWLQDSGEVSAVGHRIVHGGADYREPHFASPELLATLRKLVPFAPEHLPHEIAAIETIARRFPSARQVACFDTAFHRHMPERAQVYALPRDPRWEGLVRYGFHGISCEYIMTELRAQAGDEVADGRVIVAHLGNGASMTAVRDGRSLDTTMGLTPTGGLVMGTRSGDLDPSVVLYLIAVGGLSAREAHHLLNHQAGLLALSGRTSDMRDLEEAQAHDPRAALAVDVFCYQARKHLAALAASLGGLDDLVFTGGIGENAPAIRRRVCEDLEFMGLRLGPALNEAGAPVISDAESRVTVRVIKTNEELMIARHVDRLLQTERSER